MSETFADRRVVSERPGRVRRSAWSAAAGSLLRFAFDATVLPVAVLIVASYFGDKAWLFDMTTFFRPHIAAMAVALAILGLLARSLPRLLGALLLLGLAVYPLVAPAASVAARSTQANFRVMSTNIMGADNHDTEAFRKLVADQAPDLVVAQEVGPEWRPTLSSLPGYPYTAGPEFRDIQSTVMVASRYPMKVSRLFWHDRPDEGPAPGAIPFRIEIERPAPAKPLVVYAIHPPTPRAYRDWKARNAYLGSIAAQAGREPAGSEVIMVGDWNTPYWSPFFARAIASAGLRTSEGAWPSPTRIFQEFGAPDMLGTPIDHIEVSPTIGVKSLTTGEHFGSDHLPLIADLYIP